MEKTPDMKLRLPLDLQGQIREAAAANRRSINAEVVSRLEASFRQKTGLGWVQAVKSDPLKALQDRVDALEARCDVLEGKREGK